MAVPADSSTDLFFTLAVQSAFSWGAIGLGSNQMAGALVLMVYPNADGTNVTFSPRLATRHTEPTPYPDLRVDVLPGTGLVNGTMILSARCHNCRSWPGGAIDVSRSDQPCVYALGPEGAALSSDDPAAWLRYHEDYGSFTIDLAGATGPAAGAPLLNEADTATSSGAVLAWSAGGGKRDLASLFHALIMIFCFVALMPMGILVIRLGEWVRWHAVNQAIALALVLVGAGLGIYISTLYLRVSSHLGDLVGSAFFCC